MGFSSTRRNIHFLFFVSFSQAVFSPVKFSLPASEILVSETGTLPVDSTHYSQLVGKLIFLTITRPDITYAVNRVASFMSKPQQKHLDSALHILRYLKQTFDLGLLYHYETPLVLSGHTDADWGSCPDTRKSIGAYLFSVQEPPLAGKARSSLLSLAHLPSLSTARFPMGSRRPCGYHVFSRKFVSSLSVQSMHSTRQAR